MQAYIQRIGKLFTHAISTDIKYSLKPVPRNCRAIIAATGHQTNRPTSRSIYRTPYRNEHTRATAWESGASVQRCPVSLLLLLLRPLLLPLPPLSVMGTDLPKGSLLARTAQYIAICSGRYKAICLSVSRNRTRTLEPRRERA